MHTKVVIEKKDNLKNLEIIKEPEKLEKLEKMTKPKIHVEIQGQGQPLVFLHGWGFNSKIFQAFVNRMSLHFKCILIDLPGFGQSPFFEGSYNIDNIAKILTTLQTLPKKAIWLGWSLGGVIALWIALYFPERVKQLITIASAPTFMAKKDWPGLSNSQTERFGKLKNHPRCKILQDFIKLNLFPQNCFLARQTISNAVDVRNQQALQGGLKILKELDLRNAIHTITLPWLQIYGARDAIVPVAIPEKLRTDTNDHCKSNIQILPKAGHMPFISHETESLSLIKFFCNENKFETV